MHEETLDQAQPDRLTLIEEEARLVKQSVIRDRIRLGTETVEHVEALHAVLHEDEWQIERVPFGHVVEAAPSIRQEGDVTIIPVVKEVVEIRLVLVEEVRITKRSIERNVSEDVRLRSQSLTIEHLPVRDPSSN